MRRLQLIVATLAISGVFIGCSSSCTPSRPQIQVSDKTDQAATKSKPSDRCFAEDKNASPIPSSDHILKNFTGKVYAIGDLHGDLAQTYNTLRLAGAINDKHQWVGKCMVVVQTGDQLDRGDEDKEILDELERLAAEARAHDSRLIILNGNHELMNAQLDLRYTTKNANLKFQDNKLVVTDSPSNTQSDLVRFNQSPYAGTVAELFKNPQLEHFGIRAMAFAPGQNYALLLAHRPFYAIVNDTVFVHGGIAPEHIQYGLEKFNHELHQFFVEGALPFAPLMGEHGPFWMRNYSMPPNGTVSKSGCEMAARAMQALSVKRMVVGHTIQDQINSACDNTIWRVDIGMSKAYGNRAAQILEIDGSKVKILEVSDLRKN